MDPAEADEILTLLLAGYPTTKLSDETVVAWADAIAESGADPIKALEVARRWSRTHERFPNLAEFLTTVTPRTYTQPADDPDELRPSPKLAAELAAKWRTALVEHDARVAELHSSRGAAGHWHGGPDKCPLCGGVPPFAPTR